MTYIKNVKTLEELKKAYKKLALKLHPDCGGSDEEMAQLNNEYDDLFEKLKNTHKNKEGETYTKETNETVEQFKDIINYLFSLKMENVSVEIVGSFIWLTGNTKPYKDEIKKLEFRYSPKKYAWYKAPKDYKKEVIKIMIWILLEECMEVKKLKKIKKKKYLQAK
ncbi:molecular chaperone DnaJ (plasmid) [Streptococcus didelphis]|uniref:Molecular chaperone DnaJ n=1 Tax=Streptococcus didelphis TaxID=102886 RepID=A0ABY9LLA7_9STRE|nr:molecular chaperone DnaJ [Streptococcus didelphis]WMB28886.1 molecular chaperone DnaJ [Streptococcus didelphis]